MVMLREEDTRSGLLRKLERDAAALPYQLELVDRSCRQYANQGVIEGNVGLGVARGVPRGRRVLERHRTR